MVRFGTHFLPDYPQCHLRMARFKGTDKAAFLDNRQMHGHAFRLLDEAMLFLQRHLPVAGCIQPGLLERVDEPLFPLDALREALVMPSAIETTPTPEVQLAWLSMMIVLRSGARERFLSV